MRTRTSSPPRGGFTLGLIVGLLIGLGVALAVAMYVTKAPVPFVNKVPGGGNREAEVERNRNWDPNAPLAGKNAAKPDPAAAGAAPPPGGVAAVLPPSNVPADLPTAAPIAVPHVPEPKASAASAPASGPKAAASAPKAADAASAPASAAKPTLWYVQAGAYESQDEAEAQRARLNLMGLTVRILERVTPEKTVYRVRVGPYPEREPAEAARKQLRGEGFDTQLIKIER